MGPPGGGLGQDQRAQRRGADPEVRSCEQRAEFVAGFCAFGGALDPDRRKLDLVDEEGQQQNRKADPDVRPRDGLRHISGRKLKVRLNKILAGKVPDDEAEGIECLGQVEPADGRFARTLFDDQRVYGGFKPRPTGADHDDGAEEVQNSVLRDRRIEQDRTERKNAQGEDHAQLVTEFPVQQRGGNRQEAIGEIEEDLRSCRLRGRELEELRELRRYGVVGPLGQAPNREQADDCGVCKRVALLGGRSGVGLRCTCFCHGRPSQLQLRGKAAWSQ